MDAGGGGEGSGQVPRTCSGRFQAPESENACGAGATIFKAPTVFKRECVILFSRWEFPDSRTRDLPRGGSCSDSSVQSLPEAQEGPSLGATASPSLNAEPRHGSRRLPLDRRLRITLGRLARSVLQVRRLVLESAHAQASVSPRGAVSRVTSGRLFAARKLQPRRTAVRGRRGNLPPGLRLP